jgi:hypothetical protein
MKNRLAFFLIGKMRFRLLIFLLLPFYLFGQSPEYKNRFGLMLGYKTPGGGFALEYTRLWSWHLSSSIFGGLTSVNGMKYGGEIKYYPVTDKKILPFITSSFSRTTGGNVEFSSAGNDDCVTAQITTGSFREEYITYSNNYLNFTVGTELGKKQCQHSFALGYSFLLNQNVITINSLNDKSSYLNKVKRNLHGGLIISYTISFSYHYNYYKENHQPSPYQIQ